MIAIREEVGVGTLVTCTDPVSWDAFVSRASDGTILQSWAWGELKASYGWEPTRYLWFRGGEIRAAVMVLRHPIPGGFGVYYAPRGPVLDGRIEEWPYLWSALRGALSRRGGTILKVDPEWPAGMGRVFQSTGARRGRAIQHEATAVIDLTAGEAVFDRMSASARRNMRVGVRDGVTVQASTTLEALDRFYDLLAATASRQEFTIRSRSYYRDLFQAFRRRGQVRVYLAEHAGGTVAGTVVVRYGDRLIYLFSGSTEEGRQLKAPYVLQNQVIRDGQAQGARTYDLWGMPVDTNPSDPGWGYGHFKSMLGGRTVRFAGAWDLPIRTPLAAVYHLAEGASQSINAFAGRRRRQHGGLRRPHRTPGGAGLPASREHVG